jgi:hypothetical protein
MSMEVCKLTRTQCQYALVYLDCFAQENPELKRMMNKAFEAMEKVMKEDEIIKMVLLER